MNKPNGWDERDYKLWSAIRSLPSYGLVAEDVSNPMISSRDVIKLLELAAEERFKTVHAKQEGHHRCNVPAHQHRQKEIEKPAGSGFGPMMAHCDDL